MLKRVVVSLLLAGIGWGLRAQAPGPMKQVVMEHQVPDGVRRFYELRQFRMAWTENPASIRQLQSLLASAPAYGLDSIGASFAGDDPARLDLALTTAALDMLQAIAYGGPPAVSYNGLDFTPRCHDIPSLLSAAIDSRSIPRIVDMVQPSSAEYRSVLEKLNQLRALSEQPGFKDERVTSTVVDAGNKALLRRLWQLGILDSIPASLPAAAMKVRVKQVQQLFSLLDDGVIRKSLLAELNVPLKQRIHALRLALHTIRWLGCAHADGPAIVVNIPSATLLFYEEGRVALQSRIIVGKPATRTPVLASKVTEVVLYPYWMVPNSIATKELLPLIKRNPGYLDQNGLQVLNKQGRVVNPSAVDWSQLSRTNFPYVLRQSTGCDNSLGLVKLNFYNPFSVYLHDTPWKVLFMSNKRYFSHGCMRVERAMDVARMVLRENAIAVDTLEEKGCLRNQHPIHVRVARPVPVFVLYHTAWVDSAGVLSFHEDVYKRLQ